MANLELKEGYQAIVLPAGSRDHWGDLEPQSEEETLTQLNDFLNQINDQGGEIVACFERTVTLPKRGGLVGLPTEDRTILIVRKWTQK